jgi:hypothetical protein
MANKLYQAGLGGDTTAMIFWLKAIGGWRDRQAIDVNLTGDLRIKQQQEEDAWKLEVVRAMSIDERKTIAAIEARAIERIKARKLASQVIETTARTLNGGAPGDGASSDEKR